MVDQYVRFLAEHRDIALPNVCYTANTGRAHGLYRLAVVAESSSDLRRVLQQAEIEFHYVEAPPRIAFEFPDVAKVDVPSVFELRQSQSAFRQALDRIADLIRRRVSDQPLKELLGGRWGGLMQGYALVELLRSWGIVASEATGEGWGRYLADCVVGKLSVEELVARASPETYRRERQAQRTVSITFGTAQPMSCTADWKHLTTLAAHSYESGVAIDWQAFDKDYVRRKETLPTYPFQRRRYWAGSDPVIEGSEWTYRIAWQPSSENRAPDRSGAWLVFCDEQTKSARLIQKLIRQGQLCHLVSQKSASSQSELRDLLASQPWSAVVCCFLSDLAQDDRATLAIDWTGSGAFLARIVEALLSHPGPRLWVITQGATAVEDRDIPVLAHSPLWGLGRTISLEHPQWWGGLVDIDPADADFQDFEFPDLVNERLDQIAFRNGRRLTPQLQRLVASSQQRIQIRRDANYLITGGLGALGVYVAQWLAERGASQLTLLGRRGWDETPKLRRRVVEELRSQGVQVDVHTADVTDLARMESIFAELARGPLALRGIIHTAGRVQAQAVAALTVGDYRTIASAKVQGGWNLHRLSMPFDLDFFVLFSSAASVWGSQGSGAYSAGNHFLDTLAHYRRARGLPATTVNWARLSERGMLEADEARALQRMGVRQVPVRAGLDVMDYLVGGDLAQAVVANIDWNMFYNVYSARRERPMLEALARECSKKEQLSASPGEERAKLQNLPASQRVAFLATLIKEHLAFVLKLESAQSIGLHQGFFSLGMDSLMAVDLKERLQHMLNHPVSVSTVVTHSNTQALSEHLLAELFDGTAADVPLRELGQTAGRVAGLLDLVEDLSEQEVEQSLRRKLAKSRS
jgi:acyl transferase domain-containing protein